MLQSSFNMNKVAHSPLHDFLQYTDDDRFKLAQAGVQHSVIDQIDSENDSYEAEEHFASEKMEEDPEEASSHHYDMVEYLPEDLARLLEEK